MIRDHPSRRGLLSAVLAGLIVVWAPLPFASVPETWRNVLVGVLGVWGGLTIWVVPRLGASASWTLFWVGAVAGLQVMGGAGTSDRLVPSSLTPQLTLRLVPLWLALGLFGWLAAELCRFRRMRRVLVGALFVSAATQVLIGSLAVLRGDSHRIWRTSLEVAEGQLRGTYVNSNHLAFLLLLAVPLQAAAGYWALRRWRAGSTRQTSYLLGGSLAWIGVSMLLVGILASGSRTVMLLAALVVTVQVGVWLARARRDRRRWLPLAIGALALLAVLLILRVADRRSENSGADRLARASLLSLSESGRWGVYQVAADSLLRKPLWGNGLGSFRELVETDPVRAIELDWWHAHSDPLELVTGVGMVGALPLALAWVALLLRLLRLRPKRSEDHLLRQALLLALGVAPLHSLVDFPLSNPANALAFVALTAVAEGLSRSYAGAQTQERSRSRGRPRPSIA